MTYNRKDSLRMSPEEAGEIIADYLWDVFGVVSSASHEYKQFIVEKVRSGFDLKGSRLKPKDIFEESDESSPKKTLDDSFIKRSTEDSVDEALE